MITRGDEHFRLFGPEHTKGIRPLNAGKGVADRRHQIILQTLFNQMGQDLGVGFRGKDMPFGCQFIFQGTVIFDNPIVNDNNFPLAVSMGMCIHFRGSTVRCPSRMPKASAAGNTDIFVDNGFQIGEFPLGPVTYELVIILINQACRVISSIFKSPQTLKQDGNNSSITDISHYSTHMFSSINI